jgi:hypothetical protein
VPDDGRVRLSVVLEHPGDPIRGTLDDGLVSVAFRGWLELMSAFDTARARAGGWGSESGAGTDPPQA